MGAVISSGVDLVNAPPHYRQGDIECIDAIRAALGVDGFIGYCQGNALKYIWRFRHKGGVQDLAKAGYYLNEMISTLNKLTPDVYDADTPRSMEGLS